MKKHTHHQFLIGSWVSFYPFEIDSFEYQLDQMHEAGLNFNIFPMTFGGTLSNAELAERVEREYAARDMLYLMNGGLSEDGRRQAIELAQGKTHCIGYHLVDEPRGNALPAVGQCIRAYREADGERYPFVNLFPSYVGEAVMEGSYYEYCSRFVREADSECIEYLSHDFYPFHMNGTSLSIFADMEVIRRVALENGRLRTHAFPQASAWNGIRMPNIDEMRWNVYGYLAYGFKALSWFNLVCPGSSDTEGEGFRDSVIYRDGTIRDRRLFKDFAALNHEVLTLGDTLMKLDAIHVYHTKDTVSGVETLPSDWLVTPVDDASFLVSYMVTPDGDETYIMLVNNDWSHPQTAAFRLSEFSGVESLSYISPFNGNAYPVSLTDGVFTETFRPGEGKLYKLNGNLSVRTLPLDFEHTCLDVRLSDRKALTGVDVVCPLHEDAMAVAIQISSDEQFSEDTTTIHLFTALPADGKLRFEPTDGQYLRLAFGGDGDDPAYGYAELRVRYADEPSEAAAEAKPGLPIAVDEPTTVVIPLGASITEVNALLPHAISVRYADGRRASLSAAWNLLELDTAQSGERRLRGTAILQDGSPLPPELTPYIRVIVTYDVDFSGLDEAIAVVDDLTEAEYTPTSWQAVREAYDTAISMKDGTYPQNAVTVAYWQLLDRVRDLEPVQWILPARDPEPADEDAPGVHVVGGVLPNVVATLAGTVAGAFAGIFASRSKKKKK